MRDLHYMGISRVVGAESRHLCLSERVVGGQDKPAAWKWELVQEQWDKDKSKVRTGKMRTSDRRQLRLEHYQHHRSEVDTHEGSDHRLCLVRAAGNVGLC